MISIANNWNGIWPRTCLGLELYLYVDSPPMGSFWFLLSYGFDTHSLLNLHVYKPNFMQENTISRGSGFSVPSQKLCSNFFWTPHVHDAIFHQGLAHHKHIITCRLSAVLLERGSPESMGPGWWLLNSLFTVSSAHPEHPVEYTQTRPLASGRGCQLTLYSDVTNWPPQCESGPQMVLV